MYYNKLILTLVTMACFHAQVWSQCPTGDVFLLYQSQVDSFEILYPDCDSAEVAIWVSDDLLDASDRILNLEGLGNLKYIQTLRISTEELLDLSGLEALEGLGTLAIEFNSALEDISALSDIESLSNLSIRRNANVKSLPEFTNLDSINLINIESNDMLTFQLTGLDNIQYLNTLRITGLFDTVSLANIKHLGTLVLSKNDSITNFNDVIRFSEKFGSAQSIEIAAMDTFSAVGLESFSKLTQILKFSRIENLNLNGISPLNLEYFEINNCGGIESTLPLLNCQIEEIRFSSLERIKNLDGLADNRALRILTAIGNDSLIDIQGIMNASELEKVILRNSPMLSYCHVRSVCDIIRMDTSQIAVLVRGNAPGCNTWEEVQDACISPVKTEVKPTQLVLYPNPVTDILYLDEWAFPRDAEYWIFNYLGELSKSGVLSDSNEIYISDLQSGSYLIQLRVADQISVGRFVKI